MSQLLKALKNLEARAPKPAARAELLAHLADGLRTPSPEPAPPQSLETPRAPEPETSPPANAAEPQAVPQERQPLLGPLAHLAAGMPTVAFSRPEPEPEPVAEPEPSAKPADLSAAPRANVTERLPPALSPPSAEVNVEAAADEPSDPLAELPAQPPSGPPAARQATLLERTVRRTLADAERSEPFRQLADRLRTDMEKSGGRTVLISGVGPASETHEVILHAAAVLAERGQPILMIDADAARRSLTEQLELGERAGLAEAVHASRDPLLLVESTAIDELSLLPAGSRGAGEPAEAANRLAAVVQSLEARYRLVLIDGGRTGDAGAATLARLSDATYFVIRLGETGAAAAQSAVSEFRGAGARVLGCIATS